MRVSEQWLKTWVESPLSTQKLSEQLTMLGLEVDQIEPAAGEFSHVVVGHVVESVKHPDATRLNVCKVDIASGELVDVVCGGANVRTGLKIAFAQVGAVLPGDFKIKKAKLRGAPSHGMICSEKELGLGEGAEGCIMELASDAPIGQDIREYLRLDDSIFDIELTPNRGDCLSMRGVARDVAAKQGLMFSEPEVQTEAHSIDDKIVVHLDAPERCPHYVGRVIRGINNQVTTPTWMQERLRRAGLRSIHFIVDVTNYVMLEWGQPMHAFNRDKLSGDLHVRLASSGESLTLLDGSDIKCDGETLLIADNDKALALAGIMGGSDSSVSQDTQSILLESAYFAPAPLMLTARRLGLHSDSCYRFERGVDSQLQRLAIERASSLIVEIAGGELGPIVDAVNESAMPKVSVIDFEQSSFSRLIGVELEEHQVEQYLTRLGFVLQANKRGWQVTVPSYRSDVTQPADLVEELVRLYGYDQVPASNGFGELSLAPQAEMATDEDHWLQQAVAMHYQQAMNYPFISAEAEAVFAAKDDQIRLANPMAADMAIMRGSLLSGLVNNAEYNLKRQQASVRLFEYGACFAKREKNVSQDTRLALVLTGDIAPQQWGCVKRAADFFDIKGDVEQLLSPWASSEMTFKQADVSWLHPGRSAVVSLAGQVVATLGQLHPELAKQHGIKQAVYLAEIIVSKLPQLALPEFKGISKYPEVKRDLAVLVPSSVTAQQLISTIHEVGEKFVKHCAIFDVYEGDNIASGFISIAMGLIFQDDGRTLVDDDVNSVMQHIVNELQSKHEAQLRA